MLRSIYGKISMGLDIIINIKNWPLIFLNYFGLKHNKFLAFRFRKGEIIRLRNIENKGDTSGIGMIWEIFIKKNYNPRGFEINNKDIVIDIGSNIGVFSLYSSNRAREGKIYSYEPFIVHYKRLIDNINLNNSKNISAFNFAVCEKKGKRDLFINEKSSGMHSIVFKENSKEKISINCINLKDIFEQNKIKQCNFLKVDCEGAEYDILYNSPKNILNRIKKIALEFDNIDKEKRNCFELKKFLEKNGFEVKIKGAQEHQGILYARNIN